MGIINPREMNFYGTLALFSYPSQFCPRWSSLLLDRPSLSSKTFSFFRATSKLVWGPSTDPNKLAPPMTQYHPAQEWPIWCRVSSHAAQLVKVTFLDSLPKFMERGSSILGQVNRIRLRRLSHYKSHTDWNHEFVRADLVDVGSNMPLVMVWQRDLPLSGEVAQRQRALKIKSGLPCRPVDLVSYITEADFSDFVNLKDAYVLRYVIRSYRYLICYRILC